MGLPVSSLAAAVLTSGSWPAEVDDGPEPEAGDGVGVLGDVLRESFGAPELDEVAFLGFIVENFAWPPVDDFPG